MTNFNSFKEMARPVKIEKLGNNWHVLMDFGWNNWDSVFQAEYQSDCINWIDDSASPTVQAATDTPALIGISQTVDSLLGQNLDNRMKRTNEGSKLVRETFHKLLDFKSKVVKEHFIRKNNAYNF